MNNIRCSKCLNFIRDSKVIEYVPFADDKLGGENTLYLCLYCWNRLDRNERDNLDMKTVIPPHVVTLYND
jgi:hypothetical protein